jgi:hypothetical protein
MEKSNTSFTCSWAKSVALSSAALATTLLVSCGDSSPSPEPPAHATAFWIPFLAQQTATGGKDGLFVIPSNALDTVPAFVMLAADGATLTSINAVAQAASGTLSGNRLTGIMPATIMFMGTDSQGNEHVYGLDLSDIASVPLVKQISSLSIRATGVAAASLCYASPAQTDLTKPSSLFVLLRFTPTGDCHDEPSQEYVVHWDDSATTAPLSVSITALFPDLSPIYSASGALGGQLLFDSGSLYFYPGSDFTDPLTLINGLTDVRDAYPDVPASGTPLTGFKYLTVSLATGSEQLYQISSRGSVALLDTALEVSGSTAWDDSNFYFFDSTGVWQEALTGGAPTLLYAGYQQRILESNGKFLLIDNESGAGQISSQLSTLPVGMLSAQATPIGNVFSGPVSAFFGVPNASGSSDDPVFVTETFFPFGNPAPAAYNLGQVLTSTGASRTSLVPYSDFYQLSSPANPAVFENTDLDNADGGIVNNIDVTTLALTPVMLATGGVCSPSTCDLSTVQPLSSTVAAGPLNTGLTGPSAGPALMLDIPNNVVHQASLANTYVTVFASPWAHLF